MKASAAIALSLLVGASAFTQQSLSTSRSSDLVAYGYIPSGFTPEQYNKFKAEEAKKKAKANLGGVGPRGFKSRSMQSFQEAMERGEANHLLPVFNAKEKIKKGELKKEDIPVSIACSTPSSNLNHHATFNCILHFAHASFDFVISSICNVVGLGITLTSRVPRKRSGCPLTRTTQAAASKRTRVCPFLALEKVLTGPESVAAQGHLKRLLELLPSLPKTTSPRMLRISRRTRRTTRAAKRKRAVFSVCFKERNK
jgi:hypothetical protein